MARLDDALALCAELERLREQLALQEAALAATIRVSAGLAEDLERARQDAVRLHELRAGRASVPRDPDGLS